MINWWVLHREFIVRHHNGVLFCEPILQSGLVEVCSYLCSQAAIANFVLYKQYIQEQVSKHDMRGVEHSEEHKMIYLTGIIGRRKYFLVHNQNAPLECLYQTAHKKSAANHVVHY